MSNLASRIVETEEKSKVSLTVAIVTFMLVVLMFFWVRNETLKRVEMLEDQVVQLNQNVQSLVKKYDVLETVQKEQGQRLVTIEDKVRKYIKAEVKRLKNQVRGDLEKLKALGFDEQKVEKINELLQ